eukprot:11188637-Alexandrium_andersonii.AAC.1
MSARVRRKSQARQRHVTLCPSEPLTGTCGKVRSPGSTRSSGEAAPRLGRERPKKPEKAEEAAAPA